MLKTNIKRVFKSGFLNFWRNGSVSFTAVLIMTMALLVIGALLLTQALLSSTLDQIKSKVDINVYLVTSADEKEILALKKQIETQPEVMSVVYSSREQELADFKKRHENDELTLQALDEIGDNPLGASLEIKAKDPSQYEGISTFLENQKKENSESIIDKINYSRNKSAITALTKIMDASRELGGAVAIFFAVIAFLISFNTIRLTIYMAREEISVKRLVGASTRYIKGPFVVSGLMYGAVATLLALLLLLPITYWAGPHTLDLGTGVNLFSYYLGDILAIGGMMLLSGLVIGALSSYLAVKKYLKI
ncbi:MAG: cell division protein cell division transport system permease protein [Candidatus Taylorbacteria bacterium]|nr:cell division protein cell division transport system permease protein [Candidatus Taylorbacteria bacterium]